MKHFKRLAFLMIVAIALSSCDMLNVDVDTEFDGTLGIMVDDNPAKAASDFPYSFNEFTNLDPSSDEVNEYKDNIVNAEVGSITATIIKIEPMVDVVIEKGAILSVTGSDNVAYEWTLPDDWAITLNEVRTIENQGTFYEDLGTILKGVEIFEVRLKGNSSQNDVYFEIKFNIKATVTGSIF